MITLFTTPKPFRGHIGLIQRNALESWTRLSPDVEVVLFGDDEGAQEAARELGIRHMPEVPRHPSGYKYLNAFFAQAQEIARHPVVCYANCDIVFLPDFLEAAREVVRRAPQFLMVGRRVDLDVREPLEFHSPDWASRIRERALLHGKRCDSAWVDYFMFPRGFYQDIPPFVIGRVAWDNWLVWRACTTRAFVVDASAAVTAIHQNHDYGYHPQGAAGVWHDELASRNAALAGGRRCIATMEHATHLLTPRGLRRHWARPLKLGRRRLSIVLRDTYHAGLRITAPVRHALGIRKEAVESLKSKLRLERSR